MDKKALDDWIERPDEHLQADDNERQVDAIVSLRGSDIKATDIHDGGAFAMCSGCGRYSDNPNALRLDALDCDCGKAGYWCGSFIQPDAYSKWSEAK